MLTALNEKIPVSDAFAFSEMTLSILYTISFISRRTEESDHRASQEAPPICYASQQLNLFRRQRPP